MKRTKYNHKNSEVIHPKVVVSKTFKGYYEPWMDAVAEKLVGRLGARITDLADFFGVVDDTITNWRNKYPTFDQAIRSAKVKQAANVANALYHKAIGMEIPDTQFFAYKGEIVSQTYMKQLPPDAFAAHKLLTIIMRDVWADNNLKVDINHNVSGTINHRKIEDIPINELTEQQRELVFQLNMKQLSQPGQN